MNNAVIAVLLLLFLFSNDGFARYSQKYFDGELSSSKKKSFKRKRGYLVRFYVEGVECFDCAQDVIDMLRQLDGFYDAEYVCDNDSFEQGYVLVHSKQSAQMIEEKDVDTQLQKEGFFLKKIEPGKG